MSTSRSVDAHTTLAKDLTVAMRNLSEGGKQECGGSEGLHREGWYGDVNEWRECATLLGVVQFFYRTSKPLYIPSPPEACRCTMTHDSNDSTGHGLCIDAQITRYQRRSTSAIATGQRSSQSTDKLFPLQKGCSRKMF